MAGGGDDVFEIADYTNASPWEELISAVEQLLRARRCARAAVADHRLRVEVSGACGRAGGSSAGWRCAAPALLRGRRCSRMRMRVWCIIALSLP